MEDNFAGLRAATLAANNLQAPQDNPLGANNAVEVANANRSAFQLPASSGSASAAGTVAQQIDAAQKAAAEKAAALAKQQAQDAADPNKYRTVQKADGGYDFFAPDGHQVDIATLTKLTNTTPADWLKGSKNPIDIQYLQDSQNLQDYINAKLSNDTNKIKAYESAQPSLANYQGKGGAAKLIQDFQQHYQRYYVPSQWGATPSDNPVVPAAQSSADLTGGGSIGG